VNFQNTARCLGAELSWEVPLTKLFPLFFWRAKTKFEGKIALKLKNIVWYNLRKSEIDLQMILWIESSAYPSEKNLNNLFMLFLF